MGRVVALLLGVAVVAACGPDADDAGGASPATAGPGATASQPGASDGPTRGVDADLERCEADERTLCGTLEVPLSYDDPEAGDPIDLAYEIRPADDPDARVGSMVVDFGGPGAAGVGSAGGFAEQLPAEITRRFDVVMFDPRGVGQSEAVNCEVHLGSDGDTSPESADEVRRTLDAMKDKAEGCASASGRLLPHVGTDNVARDLDRLREALGDDTLSYYGYSYGTFIGALYAEAFPQNVGAMVLDGAVDPALAWADMVESQALGFELALQRFFDWCVSASSCAFGSSDPGTAFDELVARLDEEPIPVEGGVLTGDRLVAVLMGELYGGAAKWDVLAQVLEEVSSAATDAEPVGEATAGLDRLDGDHGDEALDGDTEFVGSHDGVSLVSGEYDAVMCQDYAVPEEADFLAVADDVAAEAPRFGRSVVFGQAACVFWAAPPSGVRRPVAYRGEVPILVVSSTHDPATPLVDARALTTQLGNAQLLVVDGAKHGNGFVLGEPCIDDAVLDYLLDPSSLASAPTCRSPLLPADPSPGA